MAKIVSMGHFTAIGMRTKVEDATALVINTCSGNDTSDLGDSKRWTWSSPTNRRYQAVCGTDPEVVAVSVECLWQGTKIFVEGGRPDPLTLAGQWRRGKAKRPVGSWNGPDRDLLRTAGAARRQIYIPAFRASIEQWLRDSTEACVLVDEARNWSGPVFLRDFDTGRGVDRNGPMSHAWVLATWLNTGEWPDA